ncbi:PilZ domain-containing protein [Candidatus Nitrospira neomarina]|uniref:PilZ domain-containing protein n=1 Tax=Candidatus Nitrospira neomarina TaxID=3020899 RepID=A0AA96JWS3_9BACT|nr:PilZ domain-containing protein [Candidatus Nitrospira neomarina]WNM62848.1 PilZ domain-containing protein [Candidatus Nitrospira neomarina]
MDIVASEDRRQDCRVEVPVCLWVEIPLAFSYEMIDLDGAEFSQWQWDELAVSPDLVKAMVDEKDLTIRDPLLLQMVTRIDWMLTSILRTLGKDKNLKGAIPELTKVSLCGSGIKFYSEDSYPLGSFLVLRLILRPFIPIQAVGKIVRVDTKTKGKEQGFEIAVEFTKISSDDREAIIRHTLRSQATMQRLRLKQPDDSVLD